MWHANTHVWHRRILRMATGNNKIQNLISKTESFLQKERYPIIIVLFSYRLQLLVGGPEENVVALVAEPVDDDRGEDEDHLDQFHDAGPRTDFSRADSAVVVVVAAWVAAISEKTESRI